MLPFPTYNIPESLTDGTVNEFKRLIFLSNQHPSDTQKELISKIAGALKMDYAADSGLITVNESLPKTGIQLPAGTELIISFGVKPGAIGLWIDLQGAGIRFLEPFAFILTIPLADLEKNANAKKILWNDMQHFMEMKAKENA